MGASQTGSPGTRESSGHLSLLEVGGVPSLPGRGLASHPCRACQALSLAGSPRQGRGLGTDVRSASKCSSWASRRLEVCGAGSWATAGLSDTGGVGHSECAVSVFPSFLPTPISLPSWHKMQQKQSRAGDRRPGPKSCSISSYSLCDTGQITSLTLLSPAIPARLLRGETRGQV